MRLPNSAPRIFQRPHFDDPEQDRSAGMLHRIFVVGLAICVLASLTGSLASPRPWVARALSGGVFASIGVSLWLLQRHWLHAAAGLTLGAAFTAITAGTLLLGGIASHVPPSYLLVIVLAGLVWGIRALVAVTLACIATALGIVTLEAHGALPAVPLVSPYQAWVVWANVIGLTAMVIALALQSQRNALTEAYSSQRRYAQLVDEAPIGVLVFDRSLCIRTANVKAAQLLGVQRVDELLGQQMSNEVVAEHPLLDEALQACIGKGESRSFEDNVQAARPTRSAMLLHLAPLRGPTGEIEAIQLLLEDASERRELESQLREAQKLEAVGQLAGGVAHDFNNLLTVITGYTETVVEQLTEQPQLREELEQVLQASGRASRLVEQLLAFSRQRDAEMTRFDLRELVAQTARMLDRLLGDQIRMQIEACEAALTVLADRGQLEQVLLNFAVNARDAMPEGGVLQLSTALGKDGQALIRVHDTGQGMDARVRERIFEPFFTTKEPGHGTGLGLATAYGIVQQAGGAIHVDSTPGEGTTFLVSVPLAEEPVAKG